MAKIRLRDREFNVAEIARLTHHALHDTIWFLGSPKNEKQTYCVGIGTVIYIKKGEQMDLVGMNFGSGKVREIYVKHNHARRQIYTLKMGQLATFYGFIKVYRQDGKVKSTLFARGLQGWYVPKNMDIVKADPNDIQQMTEENQSKINFLDDILKGEED